jgi:hypothetical protein
VECFLRASEASEELEECWSYVMNFEFEEFTGRHQRADTNIPRVAIQFRGTMSMNKGAYQALGGPEKIVFLFDRNARAIGLKAAPPNTPYAAPVRKQGESDSYIVSALSFLNSYHISHEELTVFENVPLVDGVLVLELDKGRVQRSTRRRQ